MRFIRSLTAILICFVLLGVSLSTADETGSSASDFSGEDLNQLLSGMNSGSFDLGSLLNEEVISGILSFLLALFMSLFGISLS
ncbi:hypothetical protein [Methanospirillum hungatei]|uniref:hypothetical protein n=1 Tax=Methanospirillum hungatei TaxID=2203 RepID=UPI0026F01D75|nr:hypothetical protein [Methanospirillum hungatei]MCA1915334.1 hypothetical protein [Methanospirillum hungatei]